MARQAPLHRIATLMLLVASLASTGCDREAREFAEKTAALLRQRSEQLSRKIAAEMKAYQSAAANAAEAQRALAQSSLANERSARAIALAADYDEDRKPVSRWQSDVAEYGRIDYAANRDLLTGEIDARSRFLQNLQALTVEQERVDALARLLAALAKDTKLTEDIAALTTFAEETKTEFDQKVCAQLKKLSDEGDANAKKALEARKCT